MYNNFINFKKFDKIVVLILIFICLFIFLVNYKNKKIKS